MSGTALAPCRYRPARGAPRCCAAAPLAYTAMSCRLLVLAITSPHALPTHHHPRHLAALAPPRQGPGFTRPHPRQPTYAPLGCPSHYLIAWIGPPIRRPSHLKRFLPIRLDLISNECHNTKQPNSVHRQIAWGAAAPPPPAALLPPDDACRARGGRAPPPASCRQRYPVCGERKPAKQCVAARGREIRQRLNSRSVSTSALSGSSGAGNKGRAVQRGDGRAARWAAGARRERQGSRGEPRGAVHTQGIVRRGRQLDVLM